MSRAARWIVQFALPPLALVALVVVAWHLAVVLFDIKRYLVPLPEAVLRAAWQQRGTLLSGARLTGEAALAGFGCSLVAGFVVACVFAQSRVIERSIYPYAIFLQTVPIVAIAPLIVLWFGYGFRSVVVVALVISIFPIITNATAGLTTIDPNLRELFTLAGASRWQMLVKLRLPGSVPNLVTGARISAGLSVVGAIVGEMFAGSYQDENGLGYLIFQSSGQLSTDLLFAAIFASALLGMVIFGAVSLVGGAANRWWRGERLLR
ncbi:MAG TPA: ABC transporter permease [Pirellulales bacterium]|nr:ABC transporter permease [Pirellulales bacterium]